MNLSSQAASLYPPLRRVYSEPKLDGTQDTHTPEADKRNALRAAKKQIVAWREQILYDLRPASPRQAVRVGSNEFGGEDRDIPTSSRSRLYQTRDLWTLLTLADPKQELVIVHDMLDPDILYYYLHLGVTEGRPSFLSRLGRLRTVLLPSNNFPKFRPTHGTVEHSFVNQNLSIRFLGHPSCQRAVTSHLDQHRQGKNKPPALWLYQNSPRMEGISKILQSQALTTNVDRLWLGSKHGSRQIFEAAHVPHPLGTADMVRTLQGVGEALFAMSQRAPHVEKWMVKITEGTASGNGNGILDLTHERRPLDSVSHALACLATRLSVPYTHAGFMCELQKRGAIVEAFLAAPPGAHTSSPSAQGIIGPSDADDIDITDAAQDVVQVISSHEQDLDKATGQSYEGCRYPAHQAYRAEIVRYTRQIGEQLRARGARGNFAVDYLAIEDKNTPSGWCINAIEINLRETGTTPPFMMMKLLCGGHCDEDGVWRDPLGQAKSYVASDSIHKENLEGVHPQTVIDAVAAADLEFSAQPSARRAAMTGVVLTLLPGVRAEGKIGCICIANSEPEARAMQVALEHCLEQVTHSAC